MGCVLHVGTANVECEKEHYVRELRGGGVGREHEG